MSRPTAIIEYNVYNRETRSVVLPSGETVEALVQETMPRSSTDILDWTSIKVSQSLGLAADSFEISLNNDDGKYMDTFLPFQEIVIYVGFPPPGKEVVEKSDLHKLFVGLIDDALPAFDKSAGWSLSVTGRNYAAPLLDGKVTRLYHSKTASQIVRDLAIEFGVALSSEVAVTGKKFNKTIITTPSVFQILAAKRTGEDVKVDPLINDAIQTFNGSAQTVGGPDDYLYLNKSPWDVIETLAYKEVDELGPNRRDFVAYVGGPDGKKLYFGPRNHAEQDASKLIQLTVGENLTEWNGAFSIQDLKTVVKVVSREGTASGVGLNRRLVIKVPDDLTAGDVAAGLLTQEELDGFNANKRLYGPREAVIQDRDKVFAFGEKKIKEVGIAKLREFARLTFTADTTFTFLDQLDNTKIGQLVKDTSVIIQGIPCPTGDAVAGFEKLQSRRFNGVYYIEDAVHTIEKSSGYKVNLSVTSRKPQRKKALENTSVSTRRVFLSDENIRPEQDSPDQAGVYD